MAFVRVRHTHGHPRDMPTNALKSEILLLCRECGRGGGSAGVDGNGTRSTPVQNFRFFRFFHRSRNKFECAFRGRRTTRSKSNQIKSSTHTHTHTPVCPKNRVHTGEPHLVPCTTLYAQRYTKCLSRHDKSRRIFLGSLCWSVRGVGWRRQRGFSLHSGRQPKTIFFCLFIGWSSSGRSSLAIDAPSHERLSSLCPQG